MTKVQGRIIHRVPIKDFVDEVDKDIESTKELSLKEVKKASTYVDCDAILKKIDEGFAYAKKASELLNEVRGDIRVLRAQIASCEENDDDSEILWSCIADDGEEHFFAKEEDAIRNAPDLSSIKRVRGHYDENKNFVKVS